MEEAVVLYLESHDFLNIAKNILEICDEPRLTVYNLFFVYTKKSYGLIAKRFMFLSK